MGELKLTDFRLAGFLLARGCNFLRTEKSAKGDIVFVFYEDPQKSTIRVLNSYPNSPERKYDSSCRTMHDFVKAVSRVGGQKKK